MSLQAMINRAAYKKYNAAPLKRSLSSMSRMISGFTNSRFKKGHKILNAMRRWNTVKKARHNMRKRAAAKQLAWARRRYKYGPKYGNTRIGRSIHSVRMKRV